MPPEVSPSVAGPARILVIEDDADTRDTLANVLEEEGYSVITAGDGRQAVACMQQSRPDLVITDLEMPEVGGFSVIRRLRDEPGMEALPVIIVSGSDRSHSITGLDLGADDFISKPVHLDELLARVRRQLRRAEAHHALQRQSLIDTLTNLMNRRGVYEFLERELARQPDKLAVVVIDLNDFKSINDSYGHAAGDIALRTVAAQLQASVRATDCVGRIGGDEFLLVLPSGSDEELRLVRERLQNVLPVRIELPEGAQLAVSLSMGSARARSGDTVDSLIERADLAMYAHKAQSKRHTRAT